MNAEEINREDPLVERFKKEMDRRKFTMLEIQGFKAQPNLAVLTGMAIGYQMAIDDAMKKFAVLEAVKEGK